MVQPRFKWLETKPIHSDRFSNLHPLVVNRLFQMGIHSDEDIKAFLDPDCYVPTPATEIPGMSRAADRVENAIRNNQTICVWGDFDVDGQTSTAILVSCLRRLGANANYHVPIRGQETHGINIRKLKQIINNGVEMILTCDTGITSHEAIKFANSRNVDMVITDHHDLPPDLPPAAAITNPKFLPSDHPLADLSGAGTAYKLIEELSNRFGKNLVESSIDLAGLGQVADLVKLKRDSRYIVQKGIQSLRNSQRIGIQALMKVSDLNPSQLTEEQISFSLAPRLNSLGRLSDANMGVELMITDDPTKANVIVNIMEGLTAKSKLLSNQVYAAAESQLSENPSLMNLPVIILSHPTWPAGILGIVANRLVERYNKPVILLSNPHGEPARGSARSTKGFDLHKAISKHEDLLIQFGGHPMAAGLSIPEENILIFQEKLNKRIHSDGIDQLIEDELTIDAELKLHEIDLHLVDALEILSPFGPGNNKPIFAIKNLIIQDPIKIGRYQDHIKFQVSDDAGDSQTVLWWNAGDSPLPEGNVDLAVNLNSQDWKGQRHVQLVMVDMKPSEDDKMEISSHPLLIDDFRDNEDPIRIIKGLPSDCILWIEGREKNRISRIAIEKNPGITVVDRSSLSPSSLLAIWSIPPSQELLDKVVSIVKPKRIVLLRDLTEPSTPESFLEHLMGLIRFSISHKGGKTSYSALAAVTAQTSNTIEKAISWLESKGEIRVVKESSDSICFSVGGEKLDSSYSEKLWLELTLLLEETNGYRSFYSRATKENIFQS